MEHAFIIIVLLVLLALVWLPSLIGHKEEDINQVNSVTTCDTLYLDSMYIWNNTEIDSLLPEKK